MHSGKKTLLAIPHFSKCCLHALKTLESMNEKGKTLLRKRNQNRAPF